MVFLFLYVCFVVYRAGDATDDESTHSHRPRHVHLATLTRPAHIVLYSYAGVGQYYEPQFSTPQWASSVRPIRCESWPWYRVFFLFRDVFAAVLDAAPKFFAWHRGRIGKFNITVLMWHSERISLVLFSCAAVQQGVCDSQFLRV